MTEKASAGVWGQALLLDSADEGGDEYGSVAGNGGAAADRQALQLGGYL